MESRQETQRPLLTQGEIMQLSANEEIIMVSGAPPVRAKKLRYFKDKNFTERVLKEAPISPQMATGIIGGLPHDAVSVQPREGETGLTREMDLPAVRGLKPQSPPKVTKERQRKSRLSLQETIKAIKALGRVDRDMPPNF